MTPRPDYWAPILWKRWMGTRVLATAGAPETLRVYAHCMPPGAAPGAAGGVAVLAINLSRTAAVTLALDLPAHGGSSLALTASDLLSPQLLLNGTPLVAADDGSPPPLAGLPLPGDGTVVLAPASAAFVLFPGARAQACSAP